MRKFLTVLILLASEAVLAENYELTVSRKGSNTYKVDGKNIYREVASVNYGGGETHDVILDTAGVAPGTYFLYSTELHQMSNLTELDGGMITEIVVN